MTNRMDSLNFTIGFIRGLTDNTASNEAYFGICNRRLKRYATPRQFTPIFHEKVAQAKGQALGIYIEAEARTNDGRIDAVARVNSRTYLFELKLDKSAELGLAQINGKDYFRKYLLDAKQIILIGVNFDFAQGQVTEWISEKVNNPKQ